MSYITTHIARYYYVNGTDGNAAVYVSDPGYQEKDGGNGIACYLQDIILELI